MRTILLKPFLIALLLLPATSAARVQARLAPAISTSGAIIYVTIASDLVGEDGSCSLREAIMAANTNTSVDSCAPGSVSEVDRIVLPAGFYPLSLVGEDGSNPIALGDLDIAGDVVVEGAGRDSTIIDGGEIDRVFHIGVGIDVVMQHLTIQNGNQLYLGGGCIWNSGNVTFREVTLQDCYTGGSGGGLLNWSAPPEAVTAKASAALSIQEEVEGREPLESLSLRDLISRNLLASSDSLIFVTPVAKFIDSYLTGNIAGDGGAIFNGLDSQVYLDDSTLSNNSALTTYGGALDNSGTGFVSNVTISGNEALLGGGGIFNDGTLEIESSTIVNNLSDTLEAAGNVQALNWTRFSNSLVANPISGLNCSGDADDLVSSGYNLDSGSSCRFIHPQDVSETGELTLGSLTNNGGATPTHALELGSPAIDVGDDDNCPAQDQRGMVRPADGNGDEIAHCDIGAYEFNGEFPEQLFLPIIQ